MSVHLLCRDTLEDHRLEADFSRCAEGPRLRVLQFGESALLRGFADWMIDVARGAGVFDARVVVVETRPCGMAEILHQQDGLYTVLSRGLKNGHPHASRRIVSCLERVLNPEPDWFELLKIALDPDVRVLLSDMPEASFSEAEESFHKRWAPKSFPAQLTALLYARYQALGAGPQTGLLCLSCEAVEANGDRLARLVIKHARTWQLGADFIAWLKEGNRFCNTLVDGAVAQLSKEEVEVFEVDLAYRDPLVVLADPFRRWVIEGPAEWASLFPLHEAGLDVSWVPAIGPYRVRKLRFFNGLHTVGALVGFGMGLGSVAEVVCDEALHAFLGQLAFAEILPCAPLAEDDNRAYVRAILARMANPALHHDIGAILPNSISKWQLRVLPALRDYAAARGIAPLGLSFSLAALLDFYTGGFDETGEFVGHHRHGSHAVRDTPEVLSIFAEYWRGAEARGDSLGWLVRDMLADPRLWGEDLTPLPGLVEQVTEALWMIRTLGMRAALSVCLERLKSASREPVLQLE